MGRLIITTATTVDGVIDGFEWYVSEGGHDQAGRDQFKGAAAMLLGRKTYEGLAAYWPTQEGPWGDMLNPMPKIVASRTLSEPLEWNARLLQGELGEAVPRLKDELGGDLIVSGCGELARNLLAEGLVDELRSRVDLRRLRALSGDQPTRQRTECNPLNREEYLLHVVRRV